MDDIIFENRKTMKFYYEPKDNNRKPVLKLFFEVK